MRIAQPKAIRLLDDATIDRIAAGEVIERPASVVKELVENAMDAGASRLKISLVEGGLVSIVVEDDGHGVPFRDLPLAFERHGTSKIASAADILAVGTFGFRGEALASIVSVSRCEMVSRTEQEEVGGLIALEGGAMVRREPAPRNPGTTVTVRDLFYNTPARRKYLGTAAAEKRAVVQTVTNLALAHPEVRWQLSEEGRILLDLMPAESLPARVKDIFGSHLVENLARFEKEEGGLGVSGLASRPTWTRGNRTQQFVFVNRRPIRSGAVLGAISQAYREVIPAGRFPVVMLFLQVPSGEVDINVHPAKAEVRFLLERRIFALVRSALRDGLNLKSASPFSMAEGAAVGRTVPDLGGAPAGGPVGAESAEVLAGLREAEADFFRRQFRSDPSDRRGQTGGGEAAGGQPELFNGSAREERAIPVSAAESSGQPAPFWQLHRTYIVTQIRGGLVLIDQHNSHERILFNEANRALESGNELPAQQLLFPAHLDLSPVQLQSFHQHREALAALGFAIQPFGGQSILVQGIPNSLKNWAEGQLLVDILDDLAQGEQSTEKSRQNLLASFACHGAIKAGQRLTVPEMQNLVDQLFATDLPLSCPHGRPTLVQYSLEELEKRFGRR